MNANDFFQNHGVKTVPNPNYNPKSKKNKVPRTLDIIDLSADKSQIQDIVKQDLLTQDRISTKEAKKYERYGINWNKEEDYNGSLDIQLADAQSNWIKFGNALAQTVVSEIGLGTLIGITDLFDAVGQAIGTSDHDYQNPVSRTLEQWQEKFNNEIVPIYSRPGSGFENGTDFGWWMQNLPSVASSLTLLLPSNAIIGGASKLAKLATKSTRAAKKWSKLSQPTRTMLTEGTKIGLNAGIQRTLENYQEARQTYNNAVPEFKQELDKKVQDGTYEDFIANNSHILQGIDTSNTLEVAKAIARESADRTFKTDYANTIFDILQLAAVRNIPFGAFVRNKKTVSGRRYDINSRKFAGKYKTKDELDELLKNRTRWEKTKDKLGDIGYLTLSQGIPQASEGIEEAINYIAQEEGLHLGRTILGIEANNSTFSNRLAQYAYAPELWESAVWGWLGGIIFNTVASGGAKAQRANKRRKLEKEFAEKTNTTTGENDSFVNTWSKYFETADDERIKSSIDNRIIDENDFRQKMTDLNTKGEDPFAKGRIVETEEEKEVLRQRLLSQRRQKLILNAMDSGTIDMLESYLKDKNVQNAMVETGLIKKEDVQKIQEEDIKEIERIKEQYNKYKKTVLDAAKQINEDYGIDIPLDTLQLIVRNNIQNKLQLESHKELLSIFERNANQEEEVLKETGKLDNDINYKAAIKLQTLTTKLGELQAEKRSIENDKEAKSSLAGQGKLRELNRSIETVKDMIMDINPENSVANLLVAIEGSYATKMDETGKFVEDYTNPDLVSFRAAVSANDTKFFEQLDKRLIGISEAQLNQRNVNEDRIIKALGTRSDRSILKISKELGTAYASIAELEYQIADLRSSLNLTTPQVKEEAEYLHNYFNQIRLAKIEESFDDIKTLTEKYTSKTIANYVNTYLHNSRELSNFNNIEEKDKEILNTAIKVLNLTNPINRSIEDDIYKILEDYDDVRAAQTQSSSTSQKPISAAQNTRSITNPQPTQQTPTGGQNVPNLGSNSQQQTTPTINQIPKVSSNPSGLNLANINNVIDTGYSFTENGDGSYTVTFDEANSDNYKHYNNPELFAQEEGVSIMDGNFIVKVDPQVDTKGNITRIGVLAVRNDENEAQAARNREEDANDNIENNKQRAKQTSSNPLMGEEDSNNIPIDSEDVSAEEEHLKRTSIDMAADVNAIIMDIAGQETPIVDDNVLQSIRNTLTDKYNKNNDDYISQMIEQNVQNAKAIAEEYDLYKPIANAIDATLKHASIKETDLEAKRTASAILNKAIDDLVEANKSRLGFENIDGKTYVNVESLLRFCNKVANNEAAAQILYQSALNYLQASDKYIVVDNNPKSILQNVTLDKTTRESLDKVESYSINFDGMCRHELSNKDRKDAIKEIDNLNLGDSVTYKKEGTAIVFYRNNHRIGYLPIPNKFKKETAKETDHVMQINDGWVTDIKTIGDNVESELKDLFINWIENPNNDSNITELYNTVLEYAYETDSKKQEELYNKFINNKAYKEAVDKGYTDDSNINPDLNADEVRLDGLAKLWRYVKNVQYTGEDEDIRSRVEADNIAMRSYGISLWFTNMIAPSFNFAIQLGHNETGSLTVSDITEGSRIETTPEEATSPKSALGERYKREDGTIDPTKVKLGIAIGENITISGDVNTADTDLLSRQLVGSGNTFVVLLGRNNSHDIVHAFPQKILSPNVSRTAQKFSDAIINEITRFIENIDNSNTDKLSEIAKLGVFLRSIFGSSVFNPKRNIWYNKHDGLLTPLYNNAGGNLVVRPVKSNGNTIGFEVFSTNPDGSSSGAYQISMRDDKMSIIRTVNNVSEFIDLKTAINNILSDNAYFNVGSSFLKIDNNRPSNNSIFTIDQNTGKFRVTIGSFTKEYESFNDFMLNESLITLSTKPSGDGFGNHERFGENNGPIQTIKVKNDIAQVVTSSPVRSDDNKNTITADNILDIVNSKSKNKGFAIAKLLASNIKNTPNFNKFYAKLFPKNVIFVYDLIGDIAYANNSGKVWHLKNHPEIDIPDGAVVVGKEWLDELVNVSEAGRKEAIRKLVHEQLHNILSIPGNEHYVEDIRNIFNQFAAKNTNKSLNVYLFNSTKEHKNRYYKHLLLDENGNPKLDVSGKPIYIINDTINSEGLEEFLVESLTSGALANELNKIDSTDGKEHKTLFSEIIDFILKLFNVSKDTDIKDIKDIKSGKLYEEELSIINGLFGSSNKKTTKKKQRKPNVDVNQLSITFEEETKKEPENIQEENNKTKINSNNEFSEDYEDDDIPACSIREIAITTYTSEMQSIKDQAIADGTFMNAPNGEPTNLTERQWLQVRTKAFKDWFGDWENDAANASKVVDENGEPLVVYHGSKSKNIDIFNTELIFGSSNINVARSYLDWTSIGYYYHISNNELDKQYSTYEDYKKQIEKEEKGFDLPFSTLMSEDMYNTRMYYINEANKRVYSIFINLRNPFIIDNHNNDWNKIYFENKTIKTVDLAKIALGRGFDGVIIKNIRDNGLKNIYDNISGYQTTDEYIASNPNQIKSATSNIGSFSNKIDNIYDEVDVPNITEFVNTFPVSEQPDILRRISEGEISIKCV